MNELGLTQALQVTSESPASNSNRVNIPIRWSKEAIEKIKIQRYSIKLATHVFGIPLNPHGRWSYQEKMPLVNFPPFRSEPSAGRQSV